jgi:methylthioribose-1-phosphate isomerase
VIGAGTVINPIIKIVTTVAILAAVGIFIVKPVLETTEKAVEGAGRQIEAQQRASRHASRDADLQFATSRAESFAQSLQSAWPAAARQVDQCIRRARNDVRAMDRCDEFGQRLAHTVQSDRSFALSYADSLAAQGNGTAAERVEACVKRAGYRAAAMQRCRNLADDLLFG